jgi:hypothetical protein
MMNESSEPRFSPDFAARVLREAEAVLARRRTFRNLVAGGTLVALAAVGTITWVSYSAPNGFGPRPEPAYAWAPDTSQVSSAEQSDQPDALAYLFPDAASVARFAAFDDTDDPRGDENVLFDQDGPAP